MEADTCTCMYLHNRSILKLILSNEAKFTLSIKLMKLKFIMDSFIMCIEARGANM